MVYSDRTPLPPKALALQLPVTNPAAGRGSLAGERFGYFCAECGSADVSADGLDRLVCNDCGNGQRSEEGTAAASE